MNRLSDRPRAAWVSTTLAALAALAAHPAAADTVTDFYKGRVVTLVVGYSAGGGYDIYARVLASHMGDHIPGRPTIVVQNMSGAGSLTATNYLYSVAPKDGLMFGTVGRGQAMEPLIGSSRTAYDATKFTWLGSGTNELSVCALVNNREVNTMADAMRTPFTVAGEGSGSDEDTFTKILIALLHIRAKLVTGYPGGAEMTLATERGEVDGRCGWSYSSIKSTKPAWIADKTLKVLAVMAPDRSPELPDAPAILEYARTERDKQIMRLVVSRQTLGRPFLAPPGLPPERAAALRDAFDATMKDPAFLADMKARQLDVAPVGWRDVDALLKQLYATPGDVVEETKAIIAAP